MSAIILCVHCGQPSCDCNEAVSSFEHRLKRSVFDVVSSKPLARQVLDRAPAELLANLDAALASARAARPAGPGVTLAKSRDRKKLR